MDCIRIFCSLFATIPKTRLWSWLFGYTMPVLTCVVDKRKEHTNRSNMCTAVQSPSFAVATGFYNKTTCLTQCHTYIDLGSSFFIEWCTCTSVARFCCLEYQQQTHSQSTFLPFAGAFRSLYIHYNRPSRLYCHAHSHSGQSLQLTWSSGNKHVHSSWTFREYQPIETQSNHHKV